MKYYLLILIICFLTACKKDKIDNNSTIVQFSIYRSASYSFPQFDNSEVETQIAISKTSKATGATSPLWDTTFVKRTFTDYPDLSRSFKSKKMLTGINRDDFELKASYRIKYTFDATSKPPREFTDTIRIESAGSRNQMDVNVFRVDL